jgi:hypothetical protein
MPSSSAIPAIAQIDTITASKPDAVVVGSIGVRVGVGVGAGVVVDGSITVSITWITPLLAGMSAVTTFAPSTRMPPCGCTVTGRGMPCTVGSEDIEAMRVER